MCVYFYFRNEMSRGKDKAGAPPVKGLFVSPEGQYTPSTPSHQVPFSILSYIHLQSDAQYNI